MVMLTNAPDEPNPNVLSQRYATPEIRSIFSEYGKNLRERQLWIAVMKAQRELGVNIPAEDIGKYEVAASSIDPQEIEKQERVTRHDVKAKIEAFVGQAKAKEHIHRGMTSRDLTDNVEQMQIREASCIVLERSAATLKHFMDHVQGYLDIEMVARTHHQAAQPTLMGRRFAMWTEEFMTHFKDFEIFTQNYRLRGIKGPVGTQTDMLALLGSKEKVEELERLVAKHLGFSQTLTAPGQVYPRSSDYALLSHMAVLGSACENFGKGMRLMCGNDLMTEGFKEGQVGSSAMPHKMNTRSSERDCGFANLLKMYTAGASYLAGDQWEEGDVSCSVIRRVIIPDSFYTIDGLCETTMTVLNEMGVYPAVVKAELEKYLPFLATTQVMTMATKAGMGREEAHKAIKTCMISAARGIRERAEQPDIASRLAEQDAFKKYNIHRDQIAAALLDTKIMLGNARPQAISVMKDAQELISRYPKATIYEPREIL